LLEKNVKMFPIQTGRAPHFVNLQVGSLEWLRKTVANHKTRRRGKERGEREKERVKKKGKGGGRPPKVGAGERSLPIGSRKPPASPCREQGKKKGWERTQGGKKKYER